MDHGKFRKRWEIQTGNIPEHDFIIEFDGGTSCNIPRKGFGIGYGSYKINDFEIVMVKFEEGYSSNAAEIETMYRALLDLSNKIKEDVVTHIYPRIVVCGDSCIALKWINCKSFPKEGSDKFINSIKNLKKLISDCQDCMLFGEITPFWRGRAKSVELFGH